MKSPLEQFEINPYLRVYTNWIDITITNSTIIQFLVIIIIMIIGGYLILSKKILKKRRYILERLYINIEELLKDMMPGIYKKYIPLAITIFIYILINNILGLIPEIFTPTTHFIMTMTLSLSIIIGVTLIGFLKHHLKFFNLFIPQGLTGNVRILIPFIFIIEVVSYLIRIISLSVRLSANLMSGHTLLRIIANFGIKLSFYSPLLLIFPLTILFGIYLLEIGVACIQAYVFTLLTLTYIKDSELLH